MEDGPVAETINITLEVAMHRAARHFDIRKDDIYQRLTEFVCNRLKASSDPTDIKYAAQILDLNNPVVNTEARIGPRGARIFRICFGNVPRMHLISESMVFELLYCELPKNGEITRVLIIRKPIEFGVEFKSSHAKTNGSDYLSDDLYVLKGISFRTNDDRQKKDKPDVRPNRRRGRACFY